MAETKKKYPRAVSPIGVFVYPHLNKPDTKWKPEGQFHTKVRFRPEQVAPYEETIEKLISEKREEVLKAKPQYKKVIKTAGSPFKPELDKETGDETGFVLGNFKMTHRVTKKDGTIIELSPAIVDAKGKATKANPWSGSEGRINFEMFPYFSEKDKEVGVALRLYAVQITKLVSSGSGDHGFDAVEGWADDVEETASPEATVESGAESDF